MSPLAYFLFSRPYYHLDPVVAHISFQHSICYVLCQLCALPPNASGHSSYCTICSEYLHTRRKFLEYSPIASADFQGQECPVRRVCTTYMLIVGVGCSLDASTGLQPLRLAFPGQRFPPLTFICNIKPSSFTPTESLSFVTLFSNHNATAAGDSASPL